MMPEMKSYDAGKEVVMTPGKKETPNRKIGENGAGIGAGIPLTLGEKS